MAAAQTEILAKDGSALTVHDEKSGRSFQLKGYGSLRGQIAFRDDLDLTKPIAEQVEDGNSRRKKAGLKASKAVA